MAQGYLQVDVISDADNFPIDKALVEISRTEEPEQILEQVTTNRSGQTENLTLDAPPIELSLRPQDIRPYAEYTIRITAPGYEPLVISGSEILADTTAIQQARLIPLSGREDNTIDQVMIPDHTLYGSYPPKIAESEIKPVNETGEIVLSRVVVPQTIVVHDGTPSNNSAKNYYISYRDYIKNVASSEIYATWPQSTITANVLAIMSFTLNRVYTEWYRDHHSFMTKKIFQIHIEFYKYLFFSHFYSPDQTIYQYPFGCSIRLPEHTLPEKNLFSDPQPLILTNC